MDIEKEVDESIPPNELSYEDDDDKESTYYEPTDSSQEEMVMVHDGVEDKEYNDFEEFAPENKTKGNVMNAS